MNCTSTHCYTLRHTHLMLLIIMLLNSPFAIHRAEIMRRRHLLNAFSIECDGCRSIYECAVTSPVIIIFIIIIYAHTIGCLSTNHYWLHDAAVTVTAATTTTADMTHDKSINDGHLENAIPFMVSFFSLKIV